MIYPARRSYRTVYNADVCPYCLQPGQENNRLSQYCGCPVRVHLNCLIRHIQFSRNRSCMNCLVPYQNVRIIFPNRSLARWLREDLYSRQLMIRILSIAVIITYLEYLSLLQLAVQYQIMLPLERYILQFLMFILLYSLVVVIILFFLFFIGTYYHFRQTTGHVNVIPLNPNTETSTTLSSGTQLSTKA